MTNTTPVIIGVAAVSQKIEELADAEEALVLMRRAVEQAAADSGSSAILQQLDNIAVPQGFWSYSDPGRLIANAVGSPQATTCLAGIGILQQTLINRACQHIVDGKYEVAVIVGGEAKYRSLQAKIQHKEVADTVQEDQHPDLYLSSSDPIWSEVEAERGLLMPAEFFALMESSLCSARAETIDQHRGYLGRLYEAFNAIACDNPDAWRDQQLSAEEIINPTEKNPYLAFPYTKLQNSQWNVDQAGALMICSVKKARELNIDQRRWVFPLAGSESNYSISLSERPVLHQHKGTEYAAKAALHTAGIAVKNINYFELYSCFPAVIQSHALDIGISDQFAWTQTGGMAYAGGPLNNFVIQATVKMVQTVRANPETKGMVTCISGINAKQGVGIYASSTPEKPYVTSDVTEKTRASMPVVPCIREYDGEAIVLASTVVFQKESASHAFVIAESEGQRLVLSSKDPATLKQLTQRVVVGESILANKDGTFILT